MPSHDDYRGQHIAMLLSNSIIGLVLFTAFFVIGLYLLGADGLDAADPGMKWGY